MFPVLKELLTNVVVKYVKKMVPRWQIPGAIEFRRSVCAAGRSQSLDDVPLNQDDIAFLQYTGGTTGVAKGAVLTHGNLVANLQQVHAWIAQDLEDGEGECSCCPLPLYHVYALTSNLVFMKIGAHTILITNPRDMPAFIDELRKVPVHGDHRRQHAVPGAARRAGVCERGRLSGLKVASAGGMAVQRVVARALEAARPERRSSKATA